MKEYNTIDIGKTREIICPLVRLEAIKLYMALDNLKNFDPSEIYLGADKKPLGVKKSGKLVLWLDDKIYPSWVSSRISPYTSPGWQSKKSYELQLQIITDKDLERIDEKGQFFHLPWGRFVCQIERAIYSGSVDHKLTRSEFIEFGKPLWISEKKDLTYTLKPTQSE